MVDLASLDLDAIFSKATKSTDAPESVRSHHLTHFHHLVPFTAYHHNASDPDYVAA